MPERATVLNWSEKSAEAVVAAGMERRAERVGGPKAVSLGRAVHQKPAQAGRIAGGRGETEPIADNSNATGMAQNRRVEFAITANEKMIQDAEKEAKQ